MTFNPFEKPIGDPLTIDDLQLLISRKVAEGLYVEYKREFPSNRKIGQSLASFANSYGGWYIIGIEADKQQNCPQQITYFNLKDVNDPISKVRDIAKSHIDPMPAIQPQLVRKNEDEAVLVVHIPGQQDKPFISNDGRIYRRTADSSDPVSEKDRYTIDRLYEEGRSFCKRFSEFSTEDLEFENDEHQGWLRIYIAPYPDIVRKHDYIRIETVEKVLKRSTELLNIPYYGTNTPANLSFDVGYPTYQSIVLKHVINNPVGVHALTLELFYDGWAKLLIPLPIVHNFNRQNIENLTSPLAQQALRNRLNKNFNVRFEDLKLFDIGKLIVTISILITFYFDWLGEQPFITEYRYQAILEQVRRVMPFFDGDEWGEYVDKFGLPVSLNNTIKIRPSSEGWFSCESNEKFPFWHLISLMISYAFGFPEQLAIHAIEYAIKQIQSQT